MLFNGYPSSFPGIKQPKNEVNHSPLSSVKVKNEWNYNSNPLYAFIAELGTAFNPTKFVLDGEFEFLKK
jgi:hypothetical protein